uniref:N-acetyltransferase domain-containing protein n=1 Tax=Pinguiococcus pyrenoidosus TaxID=172671 RepID=A0A7R9YET2_9STRA|mmetsp:Transcript_6645/g.25655  ORF Transcript_6645/g.25655 Transcript_6645/m.25655 type:complete len:111 (+) Transcript_6645:142-474(+)
MAEVSDVRHESPKFVLTLSLEDGSEGPEAFVEYEMDSGEDSGSIMDITHTFVPPEYRGKGVAGVLCQAAFEYCRENSLTVRPSCSYVSSRFVPKHPEFADIVEAAATEAA